MTKRQQLRQNYFAGRGKELSALRQAIIDNTNGELFWIGEILLSELEKETGFKGDPNGELENKTMSPTFEYRMVEVLDRYGLPGGHYSQLAQEGYRAIKIFRSHRRDDDHGFIIVYERPTVISE